MMDINSCEWKEIVKKGALTLGIEIDEEKLHMLGVHAEELLRWNKKSNLTAIKDPYEVAVKHVIDSVAAVNVIDPAGAVLDLGTGGGFPGIPLKILYPSLKVTLVDASRKKVSFLKHVIRTLRLKEIEAYHARGEELSQDKPFTGAFDAVICRAFSGLDKFVPMAEPYLKEGGVMVAMKGRDIDGELSLLQKVSAQNRGGDMPVKERYDVELIKYNLPLTESQRAIFLIRQKAASEGKFCNKIGG